MLTWLEAEVESPYGSVTTLHWAVPEGEDNNNNNNNNFAASYDGDGDDDRCDAQTALAVALESAEDQLGAVLWNSNSAALNYLKDYVFSSNTENSNNNNSKASSSPPLCGLRVVELGAGVGCLGIALAMAGARVSITDLRELLPLMQHNEKLNRSRVAQRSKGLGACEASVWRWGPSTSMNIKKLMKQKGKATAGCDDAAVISAVLPSVLQSLREPSEAWRACRTFMKHSTVSHVIMCDALYGNPKDWPSLLYTLSEMLSAAAAAGESCRIINFCEQRVNNVEAAFLKLLDDENLCQCVSAPQTKQEEQEVVSSLVASSVSSSGTGDGALVAELPARILERITREMRGAYKWHYRTDTLQEAHSELNMVIRVTSIEWVLPRDENKNNNKAQRNEDKEKGLEPRQKRPRQK